MLHSDVSKPKRGHASLPPLVRLELLFAHPAPAVKCLEWFEKAMDNLFSFMFIMDLPTSGLQEEASRVDIVGRLPPEIASQILRLLEGPSLVAAAGVSRQWLARCRADLELRRRVRRQLFREGRGALLALQEAARLVPARDHARTHAFARVNAHARQLRATVVLDRARLMMEDQFFSQCGPPRSSARLPAFPRRLRETAERLPSEKKKKKDTRYPVKSKGVMRL